jgi:thymidylate kinase
MRSNTVTVFSFSGIDGAGKSTQIDQLRHYLQQVGQRVTVYTFWDDVVAFSKLREGMSLSLFRGERGVGSPDRPVRRRDKNVSSGFVVAFRLLLYTLDVLRLCMTTHRASAADVDVIIFDRYIYDELANLPLRRRLIRFYIRLLLRFTPKPDIAFLVDAEPEAACARKPEYPLDFVRRNREAYLRLARIAGITVLPTGSIEQAGASIWALVSDCLSTTAKQPLIHPIDCPASGNSASSTTG